MAHPTPVWLKGWEIQKGQRLSPKTEFKPTARYVKIPCRGCRGIVELTETKAKKYWSGFCSKKCADDAKRTGFSVERICKQCGKKFKVRPVHKRSNFCSKKCYGKSKRKSWTDFDKNIRQSWQYKEWRIKVLTKDNFVCRDCKKKGNIAHHLELFALNPKKRFEVKNGIALCRKCHLKRHQKELR